MLDALIIFESFHDIFVRNAEPSRGLGSEHAVLDIVFAQKMAVYVAVLLGARRMDADSDRFARIFAQVEEAVESLIRVIYKCIALTLAADYIELRADIALEAVVVVKVLGIDIRQNGDMRRSGSKFKLMRGHLDNGYFARAVLDIIKNGIAHVTYQARLFSGGAEHGINESRGRRLALCAGHADAGKAGEAQEKIGLAGYLNTLRSLEMKERNAGGLYDNIRAVYRAEIAVSADKFDIRVIIEFDLLCVRDYELLLGQIAADKIIGRVTLAPHAEQDYALVSQMVNQLLIHIQTSSLHIHQIFSG